MHNVLYKQWSKCTVVCMHSGLYAQWSVRTMVCMHNGLYAFVGLAGTIRSCVRTWSVCICRVGRNHKNIPAHGLWYKLLAALTRHLKYAIAQHASFTLSGTLLSPLFGTLHPLGNPSFTSQEGFHPLGNASFTLSGKAFLLCFKRDS